METAPAHKRPIQPSEKKAALESFARDEELRRFHGTLLGYLVNSDRPDEARLFVDEPGQLTATSLTSLFQKLSHKRAEAWSLALFESAMAHPPRLPANAEGGEEPMSLFFGTFKGHEAKALRALDLLLAAYGVDMPLKYGQTLLHAAADSADDALVQRVLDAGARLDRLDEMDKLPIHELLSSSSLGSVNAVTLRKLAVGRFPQEATLTKFLLGAVTGGPFDDEKNECTPRPVGEILDVVRTLIELGAPAGPFRDEPSPLAAALLLPHPTHERMQVVDLLLAAGRGGATLAEALPDVVKGYAPGPLADALDRAAFTPGQKFGREGRTLLHVAAAEGESHCWDKEFVKQRIIPVLELLLARGESTDAKDNRGKTPLDLARKEKSALGENWRRIESLLRNSAAAPRGLARLGDPGFALGVAGALLEAKKLDRKAIQRAFRSAEGDDENALEAAAVDALLDIPVDDAALASVKVLSFPTEAPLLAMLEKATGADAGGESETLNVASLEGVKLLPNLADLSLLEYGLNAASLAPLAGHPALRTLRIEGAREGAEALLSLPKLERVLGFDDLEERLGPVAAALKAKGVTFGQATLEPAMKPAARKPAARTQAPATSASKKPAAKKPAAKKPAAKKPAAKKPAAKKPAVKKPAAKKPAAKKPAAKKPAAKKPAAKKTRG